MANIGEIDRLSNLSDDLLLTIISFLSTHDAARTSVLCRRFRHLWEASPSLYLHFLLLPNPRYKKFISMAKRALLDRNASHPLLSLQLMMWPCDQNFSILSSLLTKARSLDLRQLTIQGFRLSDIVPIVPIIFTINSLSLSTIHVEVPLLRKVVINFSDICERDVSVAARLLNCISHVEELSLRIRESTPKNYPIPILSKIGKDVQHFSNLKHLDVTLCFHEYNLEVVTTMLHNCPVLESIKLIHEVPMFSCYNERRKKRKEWESKLPCNADGNKCNAYFRNLHIKENRKEVIKLLCKECSSKRQACSS
ncbi:uncharacterized protein LOC144557123 [Carex rostrata]